MIQHVKFGPVTRLALTAIGAGIGTVAGMLKAGDVEDRVNKFIDTVNDVSKTIDKLKPKN